MILIKINFDANRYHATPWNKNVNEAIAEWPPSIHRLFRAMIDSYYRRQSHNFNETLFVRVLWKLAKEDPMLKVPGFNFSFAEYYMNAGRKRKYNGGKTEGKYEKGQEGEEGQDVALIYDPFVSVNGPLYIAFHADLQKEEMECLNAVLSGINYLGRSMSWVSISLSEDNVSFNCIPDEKGDYQISLPSKPDGSDQNSWFEELKKGTSDAENEDPRKSIRYVNYCITDRNEKVERRYGPTKTKALMMKLDGVELPSIYDTLLLSNVIHRRLLSQSRRLYQRELPRFSGRNQDGTLMKGHRHVYIMPLDLDLDGRIDHVLIRCRENFDAEDLEVLSYLRKIYFRGSEISIVIENLFTFNNQDVPNTSRSWRSLTPFVPPRHYRKGRGPMDEWLKAELMRELQYHYIIKDESEIESIEIEDRIILANRPYLWLSFRRSRKEDPENIAFGFKIVFKESKPGPFAVGKEAHFGLGEFIPDWYVG